MISARLSWLYTMAHAQNVRLILVLAHHIGEKDVLEAALRVAFKKHLC